MGMSYRRAWQLVEALNKDYRERVVDHCSGRRARRRRARSRPSAARLVAEYRAMEEKASAAIASDLRRFQRYIP